MVNVLGIESSCDETGVALVRFEGDEPPRLLAAIDGVQGQYGDALLRHKGILQLEGESQPVIRFTSTDQELNLTYTDRDFYGNVKKMNYSIMLKLVLLNT